ncbi:hypothetical protein [Streptomyces sp. NPDC001536]|uniref:hypothetical protein n=1 Tax=Streptomyces sp. NPDC001536 TaxID=3364583 RepID=UPI0036A20597
MTTNTPKKTVTAATADTSAVEDQTAGAVTVLGPPLRPGQTAELVAFAHHLRIDGTEIKPGETAHVAPEYARQLRNSGYLARTRG